MLVELTPTEFRLLHYLMVNAGQVVSKAQIRDRVWDYSFDGKVNMVEVYISYLRKKLDIQGPRSSERCVASGYCMRAPTGVDRSRRTPGRGHGSYDAPSAAPAAAGRDRRRRTAHLGRGDLQRPPFVSGDAGRSATRWGRLPGRSGPALDIGARSPGAGRPEGGIPPRPGIGQVDLEGRVPERRRVLRAAAARGPGLLVPPGTYGVLRSASGKVEAHLFFDYGGKAPSPPRIPAPLPGLGPADGR